MSTPHPRTQEHLDFLWPSLQARPEIVAAHQLGDELDDARLAHVPRHHSTQVITDYREGEQREVFDRALRYYSLRTVALVAGYVPAALGPGPVARLTALLGRTPVRLNYEEHYPVLLPSLPRPQVMGIAPIPQEGGDLAWGSFQWFNRFSGRFEGDLNLSTFLGLLDGFTWGPFDLPAFFALLSDPRVALAGAAKLPDQLSRPDRAVLGMLRFLTFCRELYPALEAMQGAPLTQSACWFYYAYWFKGFAEDVGSRVEQCLMVLQKWLESSAEAGASAAREGERTVVEMREALAALVSGRYAAPLVNQLQKRSAP